MSALPQLLMGGAAPVQDPPSDERDALVFDRLDRWMLEAWDLAELARTRKRRLDALRTKLTDASLGTPAQRAWAEEREAAWSAVLRGDLRSLAKRVEQMDKQRGLLSPRRRAELARDWEDPSWIDGGAPFAAMLWRCWGLEPPAAELERQRRNGKR